MNYLAIPQGVWLGLGWLPLALAALGGVVLSQGLWGARRGWEPRCRRCRHDLRGLPGDARACPECGADLTRANAVDTGRRRVRAARTIVACGVLVGAVAGQLLLGNGGVTRLRATLVARMPADELLFEVISQGPDAVFAQAALQNELATASARTMASGRLLDAVLEAGRRYEEAGLGAMAAGLRLADGIVAALDDAERTRLAELAVEELLASGGARRGLLELGLQVARRPAPSQVNVWEGIVERLSRTPEGRALLLPEPAVSSAESGDRIVLAFRSLLDPPSGMPRGLAARTMRQKADDLAQFIVVERAEFEPSDPPGPAVELFAFADDGREASWDGQRVVLLADLPPGKGTLTITGLAVPESKVPDGDGFAPRLEAARARSIAGAQPYVRSVAVDVAPGGQRDLRLVADEALLESLRAELERSTVRSRAGWGTQVSFSIDGASATWRQGIAYAFDVDAEQDGRPAERIGGTSGSGGGRSTMGGQLPDGFDLERPFRITLTPSLSSALRRSDRGELVWARFELAFPRFDAAPVVTFSALPERAETTIVSLTGPAIEARLEALAKSLPPASLGARGGSSLAIRPMPRWVEADEHGKGEPESFADLSFCGTFEARCDGRLVAHAQRWIGPLENPRGAGLEFEPIGALADRGPIVVRYLPDASICPGSPSGELRFVAVPFELVYPSSDAAPLLRILRDDDDSTR